MSDDWDKVTILRKKPISSGALKDPSAINSARRSGAEIETVKKHGAGANHTHGALLDTAKLDRETEETKHAHVSLDLAKTIMKARQAKNLTQKDVAVKINEKPSVVADYEGGRAIPSQQILGKLERALGVKLRGTNIGAPLEPRGSAKK